jgi:hypothetical protein
MKPVQGPEDLILPNVAPLAHPVLRVLEKIADNQAEIRFDRREHTHHPAPPADLQVQTLLPVGRGDLLPVDLGKVMERERVLESLLKTADSFGESLLAVLDESCRRSAGGLLVRSA